MRIEASNWGNSNENGGNVILNLIKQKVNGDILVDNLSTLDMSMQNESIVTTSINKDNQANNINLTISKNSVLVLSGDSYITSLINEDEDNSNIYLNGYKLYVDNQEVNGNRRKYVYPQAEESEDENIKVSKKQNSILIYILIGVIILIINILVLIYILKKKKVNT